MEVITKDELTDVLKELREVFEVSLQQALAASRAPEYYTRAEAAKNLKISESSLDRRTQSGELRHIKLGDGPKASVRYRKADLDAFMEAHLVMDEVTARRAAKKMRLN
jgi:excisionase family DNA binding protein